MAEYVVAQAAVLIVPTLDNFQKKLDAELKRIQTQTGPIKIDANLDSQKAVAQFEATKAWMEKQDITLVAKVDTRPLTEIRHKYEDLQREFKKALLLDLKITGLNLLPQAASAMAALNASMVQLAQSAVILPGVFAGVLSSVGALATGLSGVKAAFKEYSDAQKNSVQISAQAKNNAINVQNAYRDLGRAFKDAQRNLEDLNAQLRDAPLDEADAIIRVQEAIAEANDRAGKSGLQQQKDALAVIKAENALADVRTRNSRLVQDVAEANAKGLQGSDRVTEATERLAKATEVANAQQQKLSDSLKQTSPNAQAFFAALTGMESQWMALKNATQDRLFAGLDQEIVKLAQTDLPTLQKGFGAIADSLNGNVKAAFKSLESEANIGFLDKILGNTATAQGNLSQAFDPLIDSFMRLSAAGSTLLPRLADGLTDLLTRFDNFVVQAEGNGSLDKWMNNGIEALKDLGNSIINIGSILNSLQEAFTGSGGKGLLPTLEQGTQRLADFLKSAEGQQKLEAFFKSARDELAKWKPFLDTLPGLIQNVSAAGESWANMLMPFLTTAGRMLERHPALVQAVFGAFMLWKNIAPVVTATSNAVKAVNTAFDDMNKKYPTLSDKTDAFKNKVGKLGAALVGPGSLLALATTLTTFLVGRYVSAHDEAAAATDRQKAAADRLRDSLDQVTGAAGRASNAVIGGAFRSGLNEATNQSFGDLTGYSSNPTAMIEAVKRGDKNAALATIVGGAISSDDVLSADGGKFWQDHGKSLTDAGLTPEVVADALNGNKDAAAKYQAWQDEERRILGLPAGVSKEILNVIPSKAVSESAPSLKDLQGVLPGTGPKRAALAGEIQTGVDAVVQGGNEIRRNNQQDYGVTGLKSNSPLESLGVIQPPQLSERGAGMIVSSKPADGSPLAEEFRNNGVTFDPFDNGQFKVTFDEKGVATYLQKYASGGLISGPGTGTSDSILARLSHGEYVVNAAATQQHLPLLEKINGGKLPGFAGGGMPWIPKAPAPTPPVIPDIAPPSENSYTGPAPGTIRLGGLSDVSNKGSARIGPPASGLPPIADAGSNSPGWLKTATSKVIGWGKALLPHDFKETRTATLNFNTPVAVFDHGERVTPGQNEWTWPTSSNRSNSPLPTSNGKPIPFPDFLGQVTSNIKGGKPAAPAPKPPVPPGNGGSTQPKWVPGKGFVDSAGNVVPGPNSPTSVFTPPAGAPPTKPTVSVTPAVTNVPVVPHAGSGAAPGTGNAVPNLVPWTPGPGPGNTGVVPAALPPGFVPTPIAAQPVDGVIPEVNYGAQEAAKYGLKVSSGLRPGDTGFHGSGHAGDYTNQVQYGPPTPEMTAFATEVLSKYAPYIDELIYSGVPQNVYRGQLVPAIDMQGSPYNSGQAGYHGDHVHIAWKPGALQQLQAAGLLPPGAVLPGATSPSNMPMATTPTGVMLPQLTYGNGDGTSDNADPQTMAANYAKYVTDAFQSTLQNLAQNAGQIALKFLGSFIGIDLSGLASIGQTAFGDISGGIGNLTGNGDKKGSKDANLPANADLSSIINSAQFQQLPPSVQQAYMQAFQAQNGQRGAGSGVQYDPAKGAEQWRPVVRQALGQVASKYGINNLQAWEDDIIGQINFETGGNPGLDNLNDSNGKGGTQQVYGLGQFHPDTFKAHNVTGGDIHDPVAQIFAMIDYLASPKYGVVPNGGVNWNGNGWRNGKGYASGGSISGSGTGRSDSILARVSNGEYIVKASAAQKNLGLLNAINSGLPGFADGMLWPVGQPAPVTPPPVTTPTPPVAPVAPDPMGPAADAQAGIPVAPTPVTDVQGPGDAASTALSDVGSALGGIGDALQGAQAPAGGDPTGDPRAVMGAAPQNFDHNKPAISKGIESAAGAIAGAVSTAMQAASVAANAEAPGSGQGISSASGIVNGLISAGGSAVSGAVNILSSLGVGSITPGTSTAGAYGTPLLPGGGKQEPYSGPAVVNNWNGGVHTSNNEEFYKQQQRKELQNASPYLPQR